MFENITHQQLMLLIRALNSERNVIRAEITKAQRYDRGFAQQLTDVLALYNEAMEHPLNQRTFGDRIRDTE